MSDDVYDDDDVDVDVDDDYVYVDDDDVDHDGDVVVDDGDYDGDDRMPIALIKKLDRGRDSVAGGDGQQTLRLPMRTIVMMIYVYIL